MNREELKKTLKPLIKQCIKEVLLEESGVLSKVVNEVMQGMTSEVRPITERTSTPTRDTAGEQRQAQALQELHRQKKEMLNAIGGSAYNGVDLFEGTQPMTSGGSPSTGASPMGPMKDINPNDPGVDIGSIPGLNLDIARKLLG